MAIIEGEPWFVGLFEDAGGNALGELLRIDPATGAVDLFVSIGPADPDSLVVAAGAIWSLMRLAISFDGIGLQKSFPAIPPKNWRRNTDMT